MHKRGNILIWIFLFFYIYICKGTYVIMMIFKNSGKSICGERRHAGVYSSVGHRSKCSWEAVLPDGVDKELHQPCQRPGYQPPAQNREHALQHTTSPLKHWNPGYCCCCYITCRYNFFNLHWYNFSKMRCSQW